MRYRVWLRSNLLYRGMQKLDHRQPKLRLLRQSLFGRSNVSEQRLYVSYRVEQLQRRLQKPANRQRQLWYLRKIVPQRPDLSEWRMQAHRLSLGTNQLRRFLCEHSHRYQTLRWLWQGMWLRSNLLQRCLQEPTNRRYQLWHLRQSMFGYHDLLLWKLCEHQDQQQPLWTMWSGVQRAAATMCQRSLLQPSVGVQQQLGMLCEQHTMYRQCLLSHRSDLRSQQLLCSR